MPRSLIPSLLLASLTASCGSDSDRVASIALRDAERQSEQNAKLLDLEKEVAAGARDLVAADATSRTNLTDIHRQLQAERSVIGQQRDSLEADRRVIARQRRIDPFLENASQILAALAVAAMPLGLCWLLLRHASETNDAEATTELLLDELVAEAPLFARPDATVLPMTEPAPLRLPEPG